MSQKIKIPNELRAYLAAIGRKGGKRGGRSTSEAKRAAARRNVAAARAKVQADREARDAR